MSFISQNLNLPYIAPAQAQKHVTHNEALRALDAIVHLSLVSKVQSAPPAMPQAGERYFVASTASGDWENQDGNIAAYQDGAWAFYSLQTGWRAWVVDESQLMVWDGTSWQAVAPTPEHQNLDFVGINTTADITNRLALSSPATLFNHAGAGHQVKLNKNAATDTASMLYQSNWSGRAEIGLTGDDDFHFKVSPDGSTFHEAFVIDKNTGNTDFKKPATLNGAVIWTGENDGAGTGLDADLLDGKHADDFYEKIPSAGTGKRVFLGAKTSIGYDLGTPIRGVRYNIEIEGTNVSLGIADMFLVEITGYQFGGVDCIKLMFSFYVKNANIQQIDTHDIIGTMGAIGVYVSTNNKPTIFFETTANNYYTTFIVEGVRVGNGAGVMSNGITTSTTEIGVQL